MINVGLNVQENKKHYMSNVACLLQKAPNQPSMLKSLLNEMDINARNKWEKNALNQFRTRQLRLIFALTMTNLYILV
jgi:hypothetical protein